MNATRGTEKQDMDKRMFIGYNNTSLSHERCAICGGDAGRFMGGSNIPLEVMAIAEDTESATVVCPDCQQQHAPELKAALEAYYTQSQKTEKRSDKMVTKEQRQALDREIRKLHEEQTINLGLLQKVHRVIQELGDLYFNGGFTDETWLNYLNELKQRHLSFFYDSQPLTEGEMEAYDNSFVVYHACLFLEENYNQEGAPDGAGALLKRIVRMVGELPEPVIRAKRSS